MDKLTITATLKTPFITGGGYMTFDALLGGILFDQLGDVEKAHAAIPVRCTDGLYHASAAIFEPYDQSRVAFVANMRANHSLDPDLIKRKPNGSLHARLGRLRRREFGAVMNSYDSVSTDLISWFVEGDAEKIRDLITPIAFIGKRRANGFGEVASWAVEEGEFDGVTGLLNEPLRPIPEDMFGGDKKSLRMDAAWKPAYWHPANRAICYTPEILT